MADSKKEPRTFLLLSAVIVAVLVITGGSLRTSFQLQRLREQSVVEAALSLANEKADRLDQFIIKQDNALAAEVRVEQLHALREDWLRVATQSTPTVRAVLVLDLSSALREVVAHISRSPGPDDDAFRRLLLYELYPDLKLGGKDPSELRHLHGTYSAENYLLSYWQREHAGRSYLVVAWHDVNRIVHQYFPSIYTERDVHSRVNVVDAEGRIVFGPPLSSGEYTVGRFFETTLYGWRLNLSLKAAEDLAAGADQGRLFGIVLMVLSGLVVVAGTIVILAAVARERKLSNLKNEFVANVSHDLKTPLALVHMFGELLQSGRVESEDKRKQYIDIIVTESERLGSLIENVLDFARVERGDEPYRFVSARAGEVVQRAVDVCRIRAEQAMVKLETDIEANLPPSQLDERALEIAIINLIDNGLKYAASGRRLMVRARYVDDMIELSVTDYGPGIPEEDRKRVFERFVRGDGVKQVRGSGIGLALVRHIARAHGGDAWVDPVEPHGSRFVLCIAQVEQSPATG